MRFAFAALAVAACAPPPAVVHARYPELTREAPGGWQDDDGTYHSDELPLALRLPADATVSFDHLDKKSVLVASFGDVGLLAQWWQQDGGTSNGALDDYIEHIDTEGQLDGDRVATVAMGAATLARGKSWTDPESGIHTAIRIGWKDPWLLMLAVWTPPGSARAADADRAVASLAFL